MPACAGTPFAVSFSDAARTNIRGGHDALAALNGCSERIHVMNTGSEPLPNQLFDVSVKELHVVKNYFVTGEALLAANVTRQAWNVDRREVMA